MTWVNAGITGDITNAAVALLKNGIPIIQANERTTTVITQEGITKQLERVTRPKDIQPGEYQLRLFGLGNNVRGTILIDGNEIASIQGSGDLNKLPGKTVTIPDLDNSPLEPEVILGEPVVTPTTTSSSPFAVNESTGEVFQTQEEFEAAGFVSPSAGTSDPFAGGFNPETLQGLPFKKDGNDRIYIFPDGTTRKVKKIEISEELFLAAS